MARRTQERPGQQRCPKCEEWKAVGDFYKTQAYCKPCLKVYKKEGPKPGPDETAEEKKERRRAWRRAYYRRRRRRAAAGFLPGWKPGKSKKEARREKKARVVAILGGKCRLCWFCGWLEGLQAHHLNPEEKHPRLKEDWGIVDLPLYSLDKELRGCCLLCATCHAGVEAGYLSLETAEDPGFGPNWETDSHDSGRGRFRNPLPHNVA